MITREQFENLQKYTNKIIKQIAEEIDPKAFIVIYSAREAWGKGFR